VCVLFPLEYVHLENSILVGARSEADCTATLLCASWKHRSNQVRFETRVERSCGLGILASDLTQGPQSSQRDRTKKLRFTPPFTS
jgi:hypothetical protein